MQPVFDPAQSDSPQFIDGSWRESTGPLFSVVNPTNEQVLATLASSSDTDVEAALEAARRAQQPWSRLSPIVRGDYLRAIAAVIEDHRDTLEGLLVAEVGKPASQAAGEVGFAKGFLTYNAGWDRRLEGEILPGDVADEVIHLLRSPIGVVAAICPWNFPLAVLFRKLAPALLTGNTVVVKPSEVTPLSTIEVFRLIDKHVGLPVGVLNLVVGGPETGRRLVASGTTSLVSFTGHRDTGKRIMAAASEHLTRVSLELGGKAPAIVARDADLDIAVAAIVTARHTNAGQVCTSAERVFVDHRIADAFTQRYLDAVAALTIGDPTGSVDIGPLVSARQYEKVAAALGNAQDDGATVIGGGRPDGEQFASGFWFRPAVLPDVKRDARILVEETFGPVTPIVPVDSIDDALELANDSRYGLSAYVFSRDYATVMRTVADLQFGEIYVNRTLGESIHAHHAGFKESGIGGEDGKWGLLRYTQIKTAYHHFGPGDG